MNNKSIKNNNILFASNNEGVINKNKNNLFKNNNFIRNK